METNSSGDELLETNSKETKSSGDEKYWRRKVLETKSSVDEE